jgi:hypothetical protein
MRLLGRTGRPEDNARLNARLYQIFDDRRTPDAPDALYSYLREIPMASSAESGRGRFRFLGGGAGPKIRAVAALSLILVVAVGAGVAITRTGGVGGAPSSSSGPSWPAPPSPPAGWHRLFGGGGSGTYGFTSLRFDPELRIAVHVLCAGPDTLMVMATSTEREPAFGVPSQGTLFNCIGEGWQEGRVEFTAPTGSPFVEIYAAAIPGAGGIVATRFWVSVEVPD